MTLKKLTIVIVLVVLILLGIKTWYSKSGKDIIKKATSDPYKEQDVINIKEETVKSKELYDYNFYLQPAIAEVTYKVNEECMDEEKEAGQCDSNNTFTIKGMQPGKATLWIVQNVDLHKASRSNTKVYNLIVNKDLKVTLEEIDYKKLPAV